MLARNDMNKMKIGIASYTNDQWQLLKGCAADREKLDRTYADWEKTRDEAIRMLRGQGYEPVLVPMDVGEIEKWCQAKDKANDMSSRAEICIEKMKNMPANKPSDRTR